MVLLALLVFGTHVVIIQVTLSFSFHLLVNRLGAILHQKGHGHSHGFNPQKKTSNKTSKASPSSFIIVEEEENVNVRAAFIHVLGDFLQSIGVFIAALLIWFKVSFVLIVRLSYTQKIVFLFPNPMP